MKWNEIFRFVLPRLNAYPMTSFLCFGTVVSVIRALCRSARGEDPWVNKVFGDDDLDIGVFFDEYEPQFINVFAQNLFEIKNVLIHDVNRKPLYYSISPNKDMKNVIGNVEIDIFCWFEWNGYYWHTFDAKREKRKIPGEYHLKGVPKWTLKKMVAVDNVMNSSHWFKIPEKYGTLMDMWYPPVQENPLGWLKPHKCISDAPRIIEFKSFKDLENNKFRKIKWMEY